MAKRKTSNKTRKQARAKRVGRRKYSDDQRRRAVADAEALGLTEAACKHAVPKSTLHAWTQSPAWRALAQEAESVEAPLRGRRFTAEQREHALTLVASGMKRTEIAKAIGTTTESVRRWIEAAKESGSMPAVPVVKASRAPSQATAATSATSAPSVYAPRDPGQGLSDAETEAILSYKKKHPSMGPAQLRAQLKRFKGWRISIKAIARVLRQHGYELVHRGSRPQGPEPVRFEAPRPNALWQMDFAEMRIVGEKLHLLVVVDDFSRYCVGYALADEPSAEVTIEVLSRAFARHGKPEAIRTDRGGAFKAGELERMLEAELIDHIVGRSYHPQGGGKVESLIGTVRRELWDVVVFVDRAAAERQLAGFVVHYNERRAHMGIDGLTPADRYHGRADRVLAVIDATSRRRAGALAHSGPDGGAFEEALGSQRGAPLEVLRLVISGGVFELRFCGARCVLGPIETTRA
jgi:transposase InsO family protein